ncbi:ethanolamine utilization protein EutJ [Suicoccus acidiformans]|uniref:ethanolamine utilization protein EutJ n=1 Tax=Suicoccus acidiformans TaxID=2036206 RepID=UPI0013C34574|nr:ethanolamine utilization protein EutJ [Suicoccus acidiformans]
MKQESIEIFKKAHAIVNQKDYTKPEMSDKIYAGIDVGTSSLVLVILNDKKTPLYVGLQEANVVRDGLLVNYSEAISIYRKLLAEAEAILNRPIQVMSGSVPPGTVGNNKSVISNIIQDLGIEVDQIIDEPVAASLALDIQNGHIIDVGGGTTGIATIVDGRLVHVLDEATGGHHLSLVISGNQGIRLEEAEQFKRKHAEESELLAIVRPVIEKIGHIAEQAIIASQAPNDLSIYLVGGASRIRGFESVLEKYLNRKVIKAIHPELVTPIGIALSNRN